MLCFRPTSLGMIGIEEKDEAISRLFFASEAETTSSAEPPLPPEPPLITEAFTQLEAYLKRQRRNFDLPLRPTGSPFMQAVWAALCTIPYGSTATYKQVAEAVGNPKAVRAVGQANNRNPIAIIIPCHRVIGSNGRLVGYAGGLDIKLNLLRLEQPDLLS